MRKDISVDEAIVRFERPIKKYGTSDDVEEVRGVLAGPPYPLMVASADIDYLDIDPLDDPEANRIFQAYIKSYIQNGGESNPSPVILETMRIGAELQVLREQQLERILEGVF